MMLVLHFPDVAHVLQKEGDQTAEVLALPSAQKNKGIKLQVTSLVNYSVFL